MKKIILASILALSLIPFLAGAYTPDIFSIPEGATVKSADNPDVYIIKYKNGKQFKRLILNPQVFESYGHLKWENVLTIEQSVLDAYAISDLVTVYGTKDVYRLVPNGDDGSKFLITSQIYDTDSVYIINDTDFRNYVLQQLSEITTNLTNLQNTVNQQTQVSQSQQGQITQQQQTIQSQQQQIDQQNQIIQQQQSQVNQQNQTIQQQQSQITQLQNPPLITAPLIPEVIDACSNIDGIQSYADANEMGKEIRDSKPFIKADGSTYVNSYCYPRREDWKMFDPEYDWCSNLEGLQHNIPTFMYQKNEECFEIPM